MFRIEVGDKGTIVAAGRFDATRVDEAKAVLETVHAGVTLDVGGLEYISSAGIGVLVATQKRLVERGEGLRLVNASEPIKQVFRYSGLAQFFGIV